MRRVANKRFAVKYIQYIQYKEELSLPCRHEYCPRGRILDQQGRIGYPRPTLPSRLRPLNTEGAVGVMRQVANKRFAVKEELSLSCRHEHCPRGRILDDRVGGGQPTSAVMNTAPEYGGSSRGYARVANTRVNG